MLLSYRNCVVTFFCLFIKNVLAVYASGDFFSGVIQPNLDISFRLGERDERQKQFWQLISELENFYDIRYDIITDQLSIDVFDTPLSAFLVMETLQYRHTPDIFSLWINNMFPTWIELKDARKEIKYWKRSVIIIIARVLDSPPPSVTLDVNNYSDSIKSPIVAPYIRISNNLPSLLTQEAYHAHALTELERASLSLEQILFKQECLDHLLLRLLDVNDIKEYSMVQTNYIEWTESVVLEWLSSSKSMYSHILTLNSSSSSSSSSSSNNNNSIDSSDKMESLSQAIAALLVTFLNVSDKLISPAVQQQRIIRWRTKHYKHNNTATTTTTTTITSTARMQEVSNTQFIEEDHLILKNISQCILMSQTDHKCQRMAMSR